MLKLLITLFSLVFILSFQTMFAFSAARPIQASQADTVFSKDSFEPLMTYMEKTLRYPQAARQAGVQGNVILSFDLTPDGTIVNAGIFGTEGFSESAKGIDREAVKTLNGFKDKKKILKPGSYLLPVTFELDIKQPRLRIDPAITKRPNCLYQILVTGGYR